MKTLDIVKRLNIDDNERVAILRKKTCDLYIGKEHQGAVAKLHEAFISDDINTGILNPYTIFSEKGPKGTLTILQLPPHRRTIHYRGEKQSAKDYSAYRSKPYSVIMPSVVYLELTQHHKFKSASVYLASKPIKSLNDRLLHFPFGNTDLDAICWGNVRRESSPFPSWAAYINIERFLSSNFNDGLGSHLKTKIEKYMKEVDKIEELSSRTMGKYFKRPQNLSVKSAIKYLYDDNY